LVIAGDVTCQCKNKLDLSSSDWVAFRHAFDKALANVQPLYERVPDPRV
jgi:hypothetical protein